MGSRLFRHTDIGAPILNGLVKPNNTLIPLLKAVLVDGYGSTPPLGYTLEFEDIDNAVAVFRQPEGSRQYLRFNEGIVQGNYCEFISYETMSSVNEGIAPCPSIAEVTNRYVYKSVTANSIQKPWTIIGDSKGFYFIPQADYVANGSITDNQNQFLYFGDYMPFSEEDRDIFCCALNIANGRGMFFPGTTTEIPVFHVARYRNREIGTRNLGIMSGSSQQLMFGESSYYRPPGNALMFTTPWIFEVFVLLKGDVGPYDPTKAGPYPMGMLPGFQNIVGNLWGYSAAELIERTKPYFVTENGENRYFIFCMKNNNSFYEGQMQRMCIRLGEDFRNV